MLPTFKGTAVTQPDPRETAMMRRWQASLRHVAIAAVTALALVGCTDVQSVSGQQTVSDAQTATADTSVEVGESSRESTSDGPQRLGLHVTAQELAIWRDRALGRDRVDGRPTNYISQGDVTPNSPGDWDRIRSMKDRFLSRPEQYVWRGPTHDWPNRIVNHASWPRDERGVPGTRDQRFAAEPIRDAAFYAMVLGSQAVPNASIPASERDAILAKVKGALLMMIRSKYNDYGNAQRYDRDRFGTGFHPAFQLAAWVNKLVYTYDYAQVANPDLWTAAEKAEFIGWLDEAAEWMSQIVDKRRSGMFKPDGTPTAKADEPETAVIWAGGPRAEKVHVRMDNHVPRLAAIPTLAGLLAELDDKRSEVSTLDASRIDALVDYGRRSIRDYLVAEFIAAEGGNGGGQRSGGGNMYRWVGDTGPTEGWKYAMSHLGRNVTLADHIARAGDTSVYEQSTTAGTSVSAGTLPEDGLYGSGGPKTLRAAVERMWQYIDETTTPPRYGCSDCARASHRYDSTDGVKGYERPHEWESIQANLYFRSEFLKSIYLRERPGTPHLPENPWSGQYWLENGDNGAYPGANFMFAQMEGRVWPYGN